jgi:flagellar protein FliT
MREAAERGDWERLISLESQRSQLLADVKPLDASVPLDAKSQRRKHDCVGQILSQDAAIRELVQNQMQQLQLNIESNQNARRLRQAYGV